MKRTPTDAELEEIAQRRGWPLPMVIELVKGSAISEQVLVDAKIGFVDDPKAAAKRFGKSAKDWYGRLPAWFVPYHIPFMRDPVLERAKPTKPFTVKDKKPDGSIVEKTQKYAQAAKSGVHVFYGPSLLKDAGLHGKGIIVITEGEKKALACESAGISAIGLGGVNGWHRAGEKTLHPELAHIENWAERKTIYICFDYDALFNAAVRQEETALGRAVEAAGGTVRVVRFPPEAPKLDDFLATHDIADFHALLADADEHGMLPADSAVTGAPAPGTAHTDLGNAERMLKLHGEDLRYCEAIGAWFRWTGKRWERDTTQGVMRRAMETVRTIYKEADAATDVDQRMKLRTHAQTSESHARISAMVKLLSMMASISVRPESFDLDPWLISCENGTVDLRNGSLRPHARKDLITRVAPVKYDPAAKHELWTRFLYEATGGDLDMIAYLQRAVGYSLTGSTREDKLFFIYGPGGRGKGTFVNAILAPLGEYARVADISSFLERKDAGGDRPRPDLVRLMGARIALCDEVKRDARLDEGLVKTITGGSPLSVRTLNKEGFEMVPTFKMWLVANDPPIIHAEDTGMWRRMVRIPFTHAPETPDTQLRDTLKSDPAVRAAVFAWAVAGVASWMAEGLKEPKAILDSNAAYHAEMDPVGEFIAHNVVFTDQDEHGKQVCISRKELRETYEKWCKEEGHNPVGARRFAARLKEAMRAAGLNAENSRTTVEVYDGSGLNPKIRDAWRHVRLLTDGERTATDRWGQLPRVLVGGDGKQQELGLVGLDRGLGTTPPIDKYRGHANSQFAPANSNSHPTILTKSLREVEEYRKTGENAQTGLVASGGLVASNPLQTDSEPVKADSETRSALNGDDEWEA